MLTEKDYCDYETCVALRELGYKEKSHAYYDSEDNVGLLYNTYWACDVAPCQYFDVLESHNTDTEHEIDAPTLYDAQKWLREEKGIHIAPRIYLYHDANLDEQTSWECTIYVEWAAIYTIGKSLTYEGALLLGIKDAIKGLKGE